MGAYKVKTISGEQQVLFACAVCSGDVSASLREAGGSAERPTCGKSLTVPGQRERILWQNDQEKAQSQASKALHAASEATAAKQREKDAERRATAERKVEVCSNCTRPIGRLETAFLFKEHVVCPECHTRLSQQAAGAPLSYQSGAIRSAQQVTPYSAEHFPHAKGPPVICPNPNCGYSGPSYRKGKASVIVLIFLLLLSIIPGLLYAAVWGGYALRCPKCGVKVRDE